MKRKKGFLKVLSMSVLLTAITVNAPQFTSVVQGAGEHGKPGTDEKDRDKEKERRNEEEQRKKHEEEMKKLIQHVVKVEIKEESVAKKEAVESLLKRLPVDILKLYEAIGGKFVLVDGDIKKSDELKDVKEIQTKDSEGNTVPLNQHYVYAKGGTDPVIVIQASEDYEHQSKKGKDVYYEIGKALIRDSLKPATLTNPTFIDLLNKMKADEDASSLLFSEVLQQHEGPFTVRDVQDNREEMQNTFARIFAYYMELHSTDTLKSYAPDAFKYMETMDWGKLKEEVQQKETVDFKDDVQGAREWAEQKYNNWTTSLSKVEKDAIVSYTGAKYDPINGYLRESKGIFKEGEKLNKVIEAIDSGLQKTTTDKSTVVYKRVSENIFNLEYGELRSLTVPHSINEEIFKKIKDEFTNKEYIGYGFESTSLAKDPSKSYGNERYPILYKITLPQGVHGAFIEPISKYNDQLEFLIGRGYTYKINNFSIISTTDKPYVQVEVSIVKKDE
ncbi:ADP-ribosyltransferase [Bacillus mycoides]|uniref:ADP-ribosyltransferase n=1 Tax=Bacillus mycoides TaxID=1405 RepID=UPI003D645AA1